MLFCIAIDLSNDSVNGSDAGVIMIGKEEGGKSLLAVCNNDNEAARVARDRQNAWDKGLSVDDRE